MFNPLFNHREVHEIEQAMRKRMRQRMGMDPEMPSKLLGRKPGLAVMEGICPHCRKPMERLDKAGNTIRWKCEKCQSIYRIVDPKDEINRLTGGK